MLLTILFAGLLLSIGFMRFMLRASNKRLNQSNPYEERVRERREARRRARSRRREEDRLKNEMDTE